MRRRANSKHLVWLSVISTMILASCTGGINAGEQGGEAFIAFTIMLLITIAVLWYFLGRED
jgi:hypothetical protein